MVYGIFAQPEHINRTEILNEVKCLPQVSEPERNTIINSLRFQMFMNYSFRIAVFPYLFYLYKQKYFEKNISMFKREIPLAIGLLMFTQLGDYLGSELMWMQTKQICEKYKPKPNRQKRIQINDDGQINHQSEERFDD